MAIPVEFSRQEKWMVVQAARARQGRRTKHRNKDKRIDQSLENVKMHAIGIMGEVAVAKYHGMMFDSRILTHGGNMPDLWYRDLRIEVKTLQGNILVLPPVQKSRWDILYHVRYNAKAPSIFDAVYLLGWITKDDFQKQKQTYNFGYGDRQGVDAKKLMAPDALIEYLREDYEYPSSAI